MDAYLDPPLGHGSPCYSRIQGIAATGSLVLVYLSDHPLVTLNIPFRLGDALFPFLETVLRTQSQKLKMAAEPRWLTDPLTTS